MRSYTSQQSQVNEGAVQSVHNYGSIVGVYMLRDDGTVFPVFFDHRPFSHLCEGEGVRHVHELVGRRVSYDGEVLAFLD